jgi:hypothetical protein
MSIKPQIYYFLSHLEEPITEDSPLWQEPIPLGRRNSTQMDSRIVCYADYFRAARSFLENDMYAGISMAVAQKLQQDIKPQDIDEIRICLDKHGEFYHPARVDVIVRQTQLSFVLNVALSVRGKRFIKQEYQNLIKLNAEFPFYYLPQVYSQGDVFSQGNTNICMFFGEWFDGFHEFHLSIDPASYKKKILVWDDLHVRYYLSADQTIKLYLEASKILTCYYNLISFENIFPWNHAAGDFVIRIEDDRLELRLITVRGYSSMFKHLGNLKITDNDVELRLQAMLIFFLNLSIRMRFDRLDGVGEIVWADEPAVLGTLVGFFEALALKPNNGALPDTPLTCFKFYLLSFTEADLHDLSKAIVSTFNPNVTETMIVKQHLNEHVETLYGLIRKIL